MSAELDVLLESNISPLAASLNKAIQSALKEYLELQQTGQKGELTYVYISFLQSSVLCNLPWLRIDLCDENDRNDVVECFADWDVPSISDKLYRDADMLAKQDRMKDYEVEQAWSDASVEYFKAFQCFLPKIIGQCDVLKAINCQWQYGHYLGSTVIAWEKSKDEIL